MNTGKASSLLGTGDLCVPSLQKVTVEDRQTHKALPRQRGQDWFIMDADLAFGKLEFLPTPWPSLSIPGVFRPPRHGWTVAGVLVSQQQLANPACSGVFLLFPEALGLSGFSGDLISRA